MRRLSQVSQKDEVEGDLARGYQSKGEKAMEVCSPASRVERRKPSSTEEGWLSDCWDVKNERSAP